MTESTPNATASPTGNAKRSRPPCATGQRFELQFHTRISFEAKQPTHEAYERLRTLEADKFEELALEAFQKKVTMAVPVPPGALDISARPERRENAG